MILCLLFFSVQYLSLAGSHVFTCISLQNLPISWISKSHWWHWLTLKTILWLPHMHYHIAPHRHGTFRSPQSERPYPAVSKSHRFSSCSLLNGTILRAYLISILTKYQQLQAHLKKFTHKQSQTYLVFHGFPMFFHSLSLHPPFETLFQQKKSTMSSTPPKR